MSIDNNEIIRELKELQNIRKGMQQRIDALVIKIEGTTDYEALFRKIVDMDLTVREYNLLSKNNTIWLFEIVIKQAGELRKLKGWGDKAIEIINDMLLGYGLKIGMDWNSFPQDIKDRIMQCIYEKKNR